MARFNTGSHKAKPAVALTTSPMGTVSKTPDTRTFEGGQGWTRTPKTEIFLRSVGAFANEGTFYESIDKRNEQLRELVATIAIEDFDWLFQFVRWLRGPGNMRTASLMIAVDAVKARLDASIEGAVATRVPPPTDNGTLAWNPPTNRRIIDAVCQRPDEPGELLAIWTAWYGRSIPKPVKRGVADAVRRLYNGKALLKYDTASKGYRFGDILNLVHAAPDPAKQPWQGELFSYALDRRHHPDTAEPPASNRTLTAHRALMALPVAERRAVVADEGGAQRLAEAGMTWEALAGWLQGPMDKDAWEAMIPSMGIMALIRNLRNFDQAGVSDAVAKQVMDKLADPEVIARSKQFPFRFLSAYRATKDAGSLRWAYPLEQALNHSLSNVPYLGGRTLILVDRSPSMFPQNGYYRPNKNDERLGISRADQAAIFGCALARRAADATLVEFGGDSRPIPIPKGGSILPLVDKFGQINYTDVPSAVKRHYDNHDRVIVITDEQTKPGYFPSNMGGYMGGLKEASIDALVPLDVPVYMWNLAGYTPSAMPAGEGRFTMGGLTDHSFGTIALVEQGVNAAWPWETKPTE